MNTTETDLSTLIERVNPASAPFHVYTASAVTHEDLSSFRQSAAVGKLTFDLAFDPDRLELLIRLDLLDVEYYIGELSISREAFLQIASCLRRRYLKEGRIRLQSARHPALFLVSMVFFARYTDINERNFWQPYLSQVWEQSNYEQTAYGTCREYFYQAKQFFIDLYGLQFPTYNDGDVVRSVNYHSIVPFYLQDDFGRWMVKLTDLIAADESSYANVSGHQTHLDFHQRWLKHRRQSIQYLAPTLQRFVEGRGIGDHETPETADVTRRLVGHLMTAYDRFREGEDADVVGEMLPSLIERQLWDQVKQVLIQRDAQRPRTYKRAASISWVWALESGKMLLRLTSFRCPLSDEPDLAIWTSRDGRPNDRNAIFMDLYPWKEKDGWLVDELLLEDGAPDGRLFILSKDDDVAHGETI